MLKKIRRLIVSFFKSLVRSADTNTILTTTKEQDTISKVIVKEEEWFQKENDLVAEFAYTPTKLYSSDLQNDEPIGEILADGTIKYYEKFKDNIPEFIKEYKGFMILAFNRAELTHYIEQIDRGNTASFISVEDYKKNKAMEEEKFSDEIDNTEEIKRLEKIRQNKTVEYSKFINKDASI